jgi:hypothetical protein
MTKLSKISEKNSKNFTRTVDLNKPYCCEWCGVCYAKERTLLSHTCEPKRRHQDQHTAPVKLALAAYQKFYESTMPPKSGRMLKSYREFCDSPHYSSFVKFGHWMVEQRVLEVSKYIDWILKQNLPFHKWASREKYLEFIGETLLNESNEDAISRSFSQITEWSERSGLPWTKFWLEVGANQAVQWIVDGCISPWMLYNCETAVNFLERLSPEQLTMVEKSAPMKKWRVRLMRHREDADVIRQILKEAGL